MGTGGVLQASLRGPVRATTLKAIRDLRLQDDVPDLAHIQETLAKLHTLTDTLAGEAQYTLDAVDLLASLGISAYTPGNQARYPETVFGQVMMQVAQLIKAEIGLEVACVDLNGFDTHVNEGSVSGALAALFSNLAQGLAAFYRDLGDRTRHATVVTMSELDGGYTRTATPALTTDREV